MDETRGQEGGGEEAARSSGQTTAVQERLARTDSSMRAHKLECTATAPASRAAAAAAEWRRGCCPFSLQCMTSSCASSLCVKSSRSWKGGRKIGEIHLDKNDRRNNGNGNICRRLSSAVCSPLFLSSIVASASVSSSASVPSSDKRQKKDDRMSPKNYDKKNDEEQPENGQEESAHDDKKNPGTKMLVPLHARIFSDQTTPVEAYRCLVKEDDRDAPSFLFESVVNGSASGRYSYVAAQPDVEVVVRGHTVTVLDHTHGSRHISEEEDPLLVPTRLTPRTASAPIDTFCGGWVGYTGYDTVRFVYGKKMDFSAAPHDDRDLPDMHMALYTSMVIFDSALKMMHIVVWVEDDSDSIEDGKKKLSDVLERLSPENRPKLDYGLVGDGINLSAFGEGAGISKVNKQEFVEKVEKAKEHILAGDIFQVVLSHRFERSTLADPFEVYRALRVVNPSPYLIYMQTRGSIIVASSPEILARVTAPDAGGQRVVVNRPLAGTRRRGLTKEEDIEIEKGLLADEKERAEHIMLVDLGRNDVGQVSKAGTVQVESLMDIERYSHVMHISSTVTGSLKDELSPWMALRAALPAGTVSGAPKLRAMQIIDDLEILKRGPYGGGIGYVGFGGEMDVALALRTMIIPTEHRNSLYSYRNGKYHRREWNVHVQAGAGVVADSDPVMEYEETVNKAAGLARAIDLAEVAFIEQDES